MYISKHVYNLSLPKLEKPLYQYLRYTLQIHNSNTNKSSLCDPWNRGAYVNKVLYSYLTVRWQ